MRASDSSTEIEALRARVAELEAQLAARSNSMAVARREYRSPTTLAGLPLVHICVGPDPTTGAIRGVARGIIAIGDVALGVVAIGGVAVGGICLGGAAIGLVSFAGCALGLLAAVGGFAAGGLAIGGFAVGLVACGGFAAGLVAAGGQAIGAHTIQGDPMQRLPEIMRLVRQVLGGSL